MLLNKKEMDKFLGILFFYTVAFYERKKRYKSVSYIQEKSERYLGLTITEKQWKSLKEKLKDYPEPMDDNNILQIEHIYGFIETFHEVFGMKNIHYELRMYGIDEYEEAKIIDEYFDDLSKYIEIIGSSNGIHIILGGWLEKINIKRSIIDREMSLISLIR